MNSTLGPRKPHYYLGSGLINLRPNVIFEILSSFHHTIGLGSEIIWPNIRTPLGLTLFLGLLSNYLRPSNVGKPQFLTNRIKTLPVKVLIKP